uniref:Uncharacterized protein n=1 Tax=Chromera velia CCMP2878 TaxID=1169474 RepID=A0A0G4I0S8_9ALVE|eukprot:Cvel_9982.t1-p1 / transcript=Cvel_9982.t1 / gene=Cvel_9982 / organism=Chromera_velia_CCMP2878 / gene_product=hypothetical protein / transcript_product=hypothetical protein / location=Cvel_scaffold590:68988-70911(+) / protein_length=361 / sequence_SO=supercontig / SO=protein_coding / is_pseudo=false
MIELARVGQTDPERQPAAYLAAHIACVLSSVCVPSERSDPDARLFGHLLEVVGELVEFPVRAQNRFLPGMHRRPPPQEVRPLESSLRASQPEAPAPSTPSGFSFVVAVRKSDPPPISRPARPAGDLLGELGFVAPVRATSREVDFRGHTLGAPQRVQAGSLIVVPGRVQNAHRPSAHMPHCLLQIVSNCVLAYAAADTSAWDAIAAAVKPAPTAPPLFSILKSQKATVKFFLEHVDVGVGGLAEAFGSSNREGFLCAHAAVALLAAGALSTGPLPPPLRALSRVETPSLVGIHFETEEGREAWENGFRGLVGNLMIEALPPEGGGPALAGIHRLLQQLNPWEGREAQGVWENWTVATDVAS